ncbi:hypothetical protein KNP414_03196 [Paenibacillus mucilaginosus KNP414]|uniref:Uncharacterized protein n=1 Tax=Paenibacillus mucilaginosus (strain KNP414) TaxID=1036673 RepID=F8FD94_PAEMK|nr:hypothetical protein KNP414_03196 [Paenibacillus mucilaginosus KNP414]
MSVFHGITVHLIQLWKEFYIQTAKSCLKPSCMQPCVHVFRLLE